MSKPTEVLLDERLLHEVIDYFSGLSNVDKSNGRAELHQGPQINGPIDTVSDVHGEYAPRHQYLNFIGDSDFKNYFRGLMKRVIKSDGLLPELLKTMPNAIAVTAVRLPVDDYMEFVVRGKTIDILVRAENRKQVVRP